MASGEATASSPSAPRQAGCRPRSLDDPPEPDLFGPLTSRVAWIHARARCNSPFGRHLGSAPIDDLRRHEKRAFDVGEENHAIAVAAKADVNLKIDQL